jgi:hypothetical protein
MRLSRLVRLAEKKLQLEIESLSQPMSQLCLQRGNSGSFSSKWRALSGAEADQDKKEAREMIHRCRGPKRLDESFQLSKNRDIPRFSALELSLITQTLSLDGGILCLGRRALPLAPSTENVSSGTWNHCSLLLPGPGLIHPLSSKELLRCRLGPLQLV